jgi:cell division septal protein FtsQ
MKLPQKVKQLEKDDALVKKIDRSISNAIKKDEKKIYSLVTKKKVKIPYTKEYFKKLNRMKD